MSGYMESAAMPSSGLPDKCDDETRLQRIESAESRVKAAGILCNTDNSRLSEDRCRRLNIT
jgi:hypothetical protein